VFVMGDHRPAVVVQHAGVFLSGAVCEPLWRLLAGELRRRAADGGTVRPEVGDAVEAMRLAASVHLAQQQMSAEGPVSGTSVPALSLSNHDNELDTSGLAQLLHVTPRHVRRLAVRHGVPPTRCRPNRWSAADAAALVEAHRRTV
jgi:hypothetical protein